MRRPRASRIPISDAEPGIPGSALTALTQQGYTVGEVMGRSTAACAPRRGLDAQGRHVVIRVVDLPHGRGGASVLRRLADLRVLRHPGLVTVREVVALPEERAAVIMDLIDGAGLDVVLGARGRLSLSHLAAILDVLGSALAYLHDHGDVSSGNVLVTTDGRPVLVDLLASAMETGTKECAAPERLKGAPASAASDVYALARLLTECAGQGGGGARRLAGFLGDALAEAPADRPTARDLAARAPELGQASAIELPDGARLAAGSLRAAARTPTRTVGSRLGARSGTRPGGRPRSKAGPRDGSGRREEKDPGGANRAGRAPAVIRWGRGRREGRGHVRIWGCVAVLLVAACMVVWGPVRGLVSLRPAWALGAAPTSTTRLPPHASAGSRSGAPSTGASSGASENSPPSAPASPTAEGDGADMVSVVVGLSAARDRALTAADAGALAATTVPGSPAAEADTQVLNGLIEAGESVGGLQTSVSQVVDVELPGDAATLWPGARAVRVTLSQSASTRSGASGTRTVPALESRQIVLILVPGPWRVAEVREAG